MYSVSSTRVRRAWLQAAHCIVVRPPFNRQRRQHAGEKAKATLAPYSGEYGHVNGTGTLEAAARTFAASHAAALLIDGINTDTAGCRH